MGREQCVVVLQRFRGLPTGREAPSERDAAPCMSRVDRQDRLREFADRVGSLGVAREFERLVQLADRVRVGFRDRAIRLDRLGRSGRRRPGARRCRASPRGSRATPGARPRTRPGRCRRGRAGMASARSCSRFWTLRGSTSRSRSRAARASSGCSDARDRRDLLEGRAIGGVLALDERVRERHRVVGALEAEEHLRTCSSCERDVVRGRRPDPGDRLQRPRRGARGRPRPARGRGGGRDRPGSILQQLIAGGEGLEVAAARAREVELQAERCGIVRCELERLVDVLGRGRVEALRPQVRLCRLRVPARGGAGRPRGSPRAPCRAGSPRAPDRPVRPRSAGPR